MWIDCTLHVDNERVSLSVERLDPEARERTAATFAWMALQSVGAFGEAADGIQDALCRYLGPHVAFRIPEDRLAALGPKWWGQAIERAYVEFVRANDLKPRMRHHAQLLQQREGAPDGNPRPSGAGSDAAGRPTRKRSGTARVPPTVRPRRRW